MTETGLPEGKVPVIRVLAKPSQLNYGGTIFGGWIMSHVDVAGSIPAGIVARGPIVTRAVDSFEFQKPVFAGDLVSCYAEVIKVGTTSITVKVDVFAQRIKGDDINTVKVTEATLVYVAIDQEGQPRAILND